LNFTLYILAANPCAGSNNCDTDNGLCSEVNDAEVCSCVKGYTLNGDGKTCDETDECALETDACSQICTNTDGGYDCSCESGYILNVDGNTCTGKNLTEIPGIICFLKSTYIYLTYYQLK